MKKKSPPKRTGLVDPSQMIDSVIDADLDPSVLDRINDRDMPAAPNVIAWCEGPTFMNGGLFTKQAEILVRLFADFCPACSDTEYLSAVPIEDRTGMGNFHDRVQLLQHGLCPRCNKNRVELFETVPEELVAVWGQRAGKSTTVRQITTYQLHRFLKIPHVARYFDQELSQKFDIVFTAITAIQAQSTLWAPFLTAHNASPWFRQYRQIVKAQCDELGIPNQVRAGETFIAYGGTKNIYLTFKAADLGTLRGDTRLLSATDELSWMGQTGKEVKANAQEVYVSLYNSLRTVRSASKALRKKGDYNAPTALMCNISSPCSAYDKMMMLLRDGERDATKVTSHRATWEINPQLPADEFANLKETNPASYWRDFAAVPPLGNEAFIGPSTNLERMVAPDMKPLFRYTVETIGDPTGGRYVTAKLVTSSIVPDKQTARIIAVDAGESGNSFAIGVYSVLVGDQTPIIPGQPAAPLSPNATNDVGLRIDAIIEVAPQHDRVSNQTTPVHFPSMANLLVQLTEYFNVQVILWDRWQSTGEIQRLREKGIKAERYSCRYVDFVNLRNKLWGGRLRAPPPEKGLEGLKDFDISNPLFVAQNPWSHMYVQFATVRGVGQKVTKPESGEDDMFRTAVLANSILSDQDFLPRLLAVGSGTVMSKKNAGRSGPSVMVFGYSQGWAGKSSNSGNSGAVTVRTRTRR